VLGLFPLGCINVHASLLPRWRGAAPIQRALLAGDRLTGVSIMQMEAGLDTGPVFAQEPLEIDARDTAQTLHDKLAALGARILLTVLDRLDRGGCTATPQPAEGVTYADKIAKPEALLDLTASAAVLDRKVRAFNPYPVATLRIGGELVRVWRATPLAQPGGPPGRVAAVTGEGVVVCCGDGALRLETLQRAGGKPLPAPQFARGIKLRIGADLDG
jgi:methionyl-tRNA formyltransferase